ncbi:MAG: putrescine transport system permease protein, partial [Thalassolituus oleivorans]
MMMSLQRWLGANGQRLIVGIPWFWLALFFVLPFLFILKISLSEPQLAQPPYQDWIREFEDG